jgi:transcriptional regulator with XRE-family HTH domain
MDDLAVQAQIRRGRMTRYERGTVEPWISDVFAVAKALDVSPIWFFGQILAEGKAARAAQKRGRSELPLKFVTAVSASELRPTP